MKKASVRNNEKKSIKLIFIFYVITNEYQLQHKNVKRTEQNIRNTFLQKRKQKKYIPDSSTLRKDLHLA